MLLLLSPLLAGQIYLGRVVDAYTQEPVPGVAIGASDGWTETSEDGSYFLESQGQSFLIQKDGYWPSRVTADQLLQGITLLPQVNLAPRRAVILYSLNATDIGTPQAVKDGVMMSWHHPFGDWLVDARLEGGYAPLANKQASPFGQGAGILLHRWGRLPNQLEFWVGPGLHVQFGDTIDKSRTEPHLSASYLRASPGMEAALFLRPMPSLDFQWRTRLGYFPFAFSMGAPAFVGNVQTVDAFTSMEWVLGRFVPTVGIGYHLLMGPTTEMRALYRFSLGASFIL